MAESTEGDALSKPDTQVAAMSAKGSEGRKSFFRKLLSSISLLGQLCFRSSNDDFEKRLKHLSKEEAAAHTRLKRRSQTWRKLARALILYSVIIELLFLGIAIITTRSLELSWQIRAVRVLPVFGFPALAALLYSTCASYYRIRERKDQKTLDRLRAERQAKIDELKERTNYYLTQQLIQRYDTDPAAKAAAASVLASKLGAEAGLKITFESLSQEDVDMVSKQDKNYETEVADSTGIRRRKTHHRTHSADQIRLPEVDPGQGRIEATGKSGSVWEQGIDIEHYKGKVSDGGWVARLAAMLVGEDPTQCYALICGKCHMHNGLARKEDFPYITYYCPHCHTLNGSRQLGGETSEGLGAASPMGVGSIENQGGGTSRDHNGSSVGSTNLAVVAQLPQMCETDQKTD